MSQADSVTDLVGSIYEAAMDAGLWPAALDRIATHFDASFVGVASQNLTLGSDHATYYNHSRIDNPAFEQYVVEYSHNVPKNDLYTFIQKVPSDITVLRTSFQSDPDFVATDLYKTLLNRLDIYYLSVTKFLSGEQSFAGLSVCRGKGARDFDPAETRVLQHLAPHFRRAMQMQGRLALADAERHALDRLPWGIVFVDILGKVLSCNSAAQEILGARDGLELRRDRLVASNPALTAALTSSLQQAVLAVDGKVPPPDALPLPRPSLLRPLSVLVAPLHRSAAAPGVRPTAVVFVADPERRVEPQTDMLRRLYGLTAAEASLALALLQGEGLGDAAARLGIRLSTAKTQLQAVFAKTDTRRQAELVHLILKGPLGLRLE